MAGRQSTPGLVKTHFIYGPQMVDTWEAQGCFGCLVSTVAGVAVVGLTSGGGAFSCSSLTVPGLSPVAGASRAPFSLPFRMYHARINNVDTFFVRVNFDAYKIDAYKAGNVGVA
eukprot:1170548-Prorocentrum_minimum.AAC.1